MLAILNVVIPTGVTMITIRTVSAWMAEQALIMASLAVLYNAKDAASFYFGRGTLAPTQG